MTSQIIDDECGTVTDFRATDGEILLVRTADKNDELRYRAFSVVAGLDPVTTRVSATAGWVNCYYKPSKSITLRRGVERFHALRPGGNTKCSCSEK